MSTIQEIKVLKENANDKNLTVVKIYFNDGERVKQRDVLIELMTSKTTISIEADQEGYVEYLCKEEDDVAVGMTIINIYDLASDVGKKKDLEGSFKDNQTVFSNKALELIKKENLDKNVFIGKGLVSYEDVESYLMAQNRVSVEQGKNLGFIDEDVKDLVKSDHVRLQKIKKVKLLEIANLRDIQTANMNCVVAVFVDTSNIIQYVKQHSRIFQDSFLHLIVFEIARLLRNYPEHNAFFMQDSIAFYNSINIGLAMDLGQGLKVVKISDAEKKTTHEIEIDIMNLADKYLDKKLDVRDVSDITFTITDLSAEGVFFFTPLINKRQSCILGVSAIDKKLNRCVLSLTFDHRVTEGKKAADFLNKLKAQLEKYGVSSRNDDQIEGPNKEIQCSHCRISLVEIKKQNGIGLLKIINGDGEEECVCEACFGGWQ